MHSGDDYLYHDVHDKAGHRNVAQYYEITMSKTVDGKEVPITSVHKDTDTSGKLRITMPIPEEYRGHKHYSILHVHEGEPVILTDLDNDPDTVTFEVDKFSVFILLETDEEAIDESVSVAASLSDLIAESADGTSLKLQESVTEDVVVDKNIYLNLNGCSINGSVTVAEGYTLYVKDSQTDDYTVEDGNGYGKITGAVSGVVAQEGYMMITEGEETSFHRLNLDTVGLTLRANVTGVYYQSQFGGDEVIKRNIVAYGTALGAGQMPTFADKTYTRFADMTTWKPGMNANGYSNNLKNGTILQGIMSADGGYSSNKRNAGVKIYSQAYVELPNGTRILGKAVGYSLQDIIQGAEGIIGTDAMWNNLEQEQKDPILSMYATYERIMRNWNIPNIKAAAAQ